MSFYAYPDKSHKIGTEVQASDVITVADRNKDYFCPGCNAIYRFRAESSNKRAAHFYLHDPNGHDENCWMPSADSSVKHMLSTPDYEFDADSFYEKLISSSNRIGKGKGRAGDGKNTTASLHLSTIRNLYKYCCLNPNSAFVNGQIQVKDILLAEKPHIYTPSILAG